jgi:hypothetical protein
MAKPQSDAAAARISKVFPWAYQFLFMILEVSPSPPTARRVISLY